MKAFLLKSCVSFAAMGAASLAMPAFAADAAPAPAADNLDVIVVTASTGDKTKLNSSISISSVSAQAIADFRPQSQGDLLRLLPGLQPNVSGPGGNGNFAVRGLPVATGGATFVQLQEDGLPTVLYGDMQFGNNDYFTKFDALTDSVDAVRGGTTSTLASQAPGAVINYISATKRAEGGYVELEKGVNYDYTRVNFRQSGSINDSMYYNIGGFANIGHGPRHAAYNVSKSYQIRGNVTKEFADGKGYLRMLFKVADTQEPNDTGGIVCANISGGTAWGGKVSNIRPCGNYDTRTQSPYSLNNSSFYFVDTDGVRKQTPLNGITTQQKTLQAQLHYEFSDRLKLDENIRYSNISGGFSSGFFSASPSSGVLGSTVNGATVAALRYANGVNAGALYTNSLINTNTNVYTRIRDVGSLASDLKLSGKFDIGSGLKATVNAGWFYMSQNIAMDWHTNQTYSEVTGNNAAMINLYDAAGNMLTANGIAGYNNNWGTCCARTYDYTFTDNAPYLNLNIDGGRWQIDGSIREDFNHGQGSGSVSTGHVYTAAVVQKNPVTGATVTTNIPYLLPDGPAEVINYSKNTTSWSVGALYKPVNNLSVFIRASRGARFNADRMTFNGYFNADGSLNSTTGAAAVIDYVNQYEIGLKNRGNVLGGRYTAELTVYRSNFNITTYELSATKCGGVATGCIVANKYKTIGAEFYGTYTRGALSLIANMTYNSADKMPAGAPSYVRSDGIPGLSYTFAANYNVVENASIGANITGMTSTVDSNGLEYPGSAVVGVNLKYSPMKNLQLGVNVSNLFDTLTLMGPGNNVVSNTGGNAIINVSSLPGRTVTGSVRFSF
ncbi:TonB-dependent receptor [Novosphingobium sp. FSY-8]|uniref:TonB-dependent receptor n=1 Tax=Novosphingobium ovatum TaxID=1908523 RepID=A0ABW9XF06_9SPHN|nr:TonB-dependent receptor [Novosphingobium ovatum]NBC37120.1 TonB-dependent receptor [Novosphingobium ovatum]